MINQENIHIFIEKTASKLGYLKSNVHADDFDPYFWEWDRGVGLYGMLRYYQETEREDILNSIIHWFEKNIKEGLPEKNVNSVCPMLTLAYVYEYTKNEAYLDLCKEWAEWVMNDLPRTEEMGFQHIVRGHVNEQQLWDDTLYMTVLFLAKMGIMLNKEEYIDESIRQFLVHIKYLTDKKTGLLFHGWTFHGRHNFSEALWGRGNCWLTAGIVDYLDIVGNLNNGVKMFLIDTLNAQVKALNELQAQNGMWHTLLNDSLSYAETSATAGFGYGILKAVRKGYISNKYKETALKAVKAVCDRIDDAGNVLEVSWGTGMGEDLQYYKDVPICPMPYGQALTILLLTEFLKHI